MKFQKPKSWLSNFEGSGPLTISWYPAPHGDAVEALNEIGVGFFAPNGELLSVIFDDVEWATDHQLLEVENCTVEATVKKGKVTFKVHEKKRLKRKAA